MVEESGNGQKAIEQTKKEKEARGKTQTGQVSHEIGGTILVDGNNGIGAIGQRRC